MQRAARTAPLCRKPRFLFLLVGLATIGVAGCDPSLQPSPRPVCFRVGDPYQEAGFWYRGNFHMHSRHSDGALTGEELVELYALHGYGVLCISDHNQFGDQDGGILPAYQSDSLLHDWNGDNELHPEHQVGSGVEAYERDWSLAAPRWTRDKWYLPSRVQGDANPVVIPGAEVNDKSWHFGVVGLPSGALEPPDDARETCRRAREAGGFVFLAHPGNWNPAPALVAKTIDVSSLDGIEIMNGLFMTLLLRMQVSPVPGALLDDTPRRDCPGNPPPDATPLWDGLLSLGYRLWGIANDDEHTWVGARDAYPFTAFTMVLTNDPSREGFLRALHVGSFYCSTGLYFTEIAMRGDSLVACAPEAQQMRIVSRGGRRLLEVSGTRLAYKITGSEGYARVEAVGRSQSTGFGAAACWSQPFFVDPIPCERPNL